MTLDGLIEALQNIRRHEAGDTPVVYETAAYWDDTLDAYVEVERQPVNSVSFFPVHKSEEEIVLILR